MMLQPNNPDIDFAELEQKIQRTAEYRRNATRLAVGRGVQVSSGGVPRLNWRQRVRSWPVAGALLARLYHRVRMMTAPGVDFRQRIRATPGVGEAAMWLNAFVTLPRWRWQLQNELAHTQQLLAALRQDQAELQREVALLREARSAADDNALGTQAHPADAADHSDVSS